MRVSVILPVLNESNFMHIALDSLNEQTVPFELIVVDGGSTDRTVEIAKHYTPLVFQIGHGKLNGKQLGVLEATGDIILTVDADSYYPPTYVELITRHFADPKIVLVSGVHYSTHGLDEESIARARTWTRDLFSTFGHFFLKYSAGCVQAFRKDAFFEVGGYDLDVNQLDFLTMVWEEEIKFVQRMSQVGKVVYDPSAKAFMFDRRSFCPHYHADKCPVGYDAVCSFCHQIKEGERF